MNVGPRLAAAWRVNRALPSALAVLLVLVLILALLINYRLAPELSRLEARYIELEKKSRQAQQLQSASDTPGAIYRRGQADLEKFRALIPVKSALTDLIKELFEISRQAGLEISQISYADDEIKGEPLLEYKLKFSVAGRYDQLKKFIQLLEQSERLITIESLTLASRDHASSQIGLQLALVTYFQAGTEQL